MQHHGITRVTIFVVVLSLCLRSTTANTGRGRFGDRPGQLRDVAFSSFGHHGKKCTNDPMMWPDKYKKSKEEVQKLTFIYVAPGTREAMALHETDVSKKAMKNAKRTRSLSARSRSRSSSVAGTRSKSRSQLALTNKVKLLAYLEDASHNKFQLMRMLRMSHMHKQDLPPAGLWTAKSRPTSLLPEEVKKTKLALRKKMQTLSRKGKTLKGAARSAAKSAHSKSSHSKRSASRSASSRARSSSVKAA